MDSREYEVEFPDGSTDFVTANTIAENIYSQVDQEGNSFLIMDEIIDHKKDGHAVEKDDGDSVKLNGKSYKRKTTKGWKLLIQWKDGTTSWVSLKECKNTNPIRVAEYAVANKIAEEPAFNWWVNQTLKKRDRIIKKVRTRFMAKATKYGIQLPRTVKEALEIDAATGTTFWRDAIKKEMKNVECAFDFENGILKGSRKIICHMVFDIKMDLTRKARLVAGGHMTEAPKDTTFSSVVSRDSVRIMFTVAALNDLKVLAADVQNAYLNAPTKEKVYCIAGPEFGTRAGQEVQIVRALYGLKSSGARWRDHMASSLRELDFKSCLADPDVWLRPAIKKNGDKYYEYVLVYVDDLLVVSEEPMLVMDELGKRYTLKDGSVHEPTTYLGAQFGKFKIKTSQDPDKERWSMSSDNYVKQAIKDVEAEVKLMQKKLPTRVTTPLSAGYRPEVDGSPELPDDSVRTFQKHIGVLRWICELGRVDVMVAISMLSRYSAAPQEGHLQQVYHIFAYLKEHSCSRMVFNDEEPDYCNM